MTRPSILRRCSSLFRFGGGRARLFASPNARAVLFPARQLHPRKDGSQESGYALLLVLFMMTVMVITSMAVLVDRRTQGRREREDQMIWRGNQFVRAIRLYYRKTGHYPQDLDTLKKGVADLQFIRPEVLRDPMNKDGDGKWRFIYTNPAGQIMGSVKYATMQQMAILDLYGVQVAKLQKANSDSDQENGFGDQTAGAPNCPPASSGGLTQTAAPQGMGLPATAPGGGANPFQGQFMSQTSTASPFSNKSNSTCGPQLPGMPAMAPAALQALLKMKPTGPVDSPVIGGFLVGVGSTVDRTSVKVYKGGKKYQQWEFIYNPIEEQALAIQQGLTQAGSAGGLFGSPAQGNGLPGPATTTTGGIGTAPIQAPPSFPQPPQNQQ